MPFGLVSVTRAVTKRARRGLFAGKKVLFGNNISQDGGNRTRRQWKPNAQKNTIYSDILERGIQLRVTTAALRNIDKAGGLDNYVLNTPEKKLQSDVGSDLKRKMLHRLLRQHRNGHETKSIPAQTGI